MLRKLSAGLLLLALCLLFSCGGDSSGALSVAPGSEAAVEQPEATLLPGTPGLLSGARNSPDASAELPLPKRSAQAGRDFASNRFIVIFETKPDSQALAPYLGGGSDGKAGLVRLSDNAPLVANPTLREVSSNLGAHYGVSLDRRVFYKQVNFAVYETGALDSVADLDALMLRVLHENRGLVREVCYDMYVQALGAVDGTGRQMSHAEFKRLFGPQAAPARRVSAPPNDPLHLNKAGTQGGSWANWRCGAFDTYTDEDSNVLEGAWTKKTSSPDVLVGLIDTGCRMTHQDLVGSVITPSTTAPYNAPGILTDIINKDNDPADDYGHGTYCAGIIGAQGNNAIGLSGMSQSVKILPLKVIAANGWGTDAQVAEGMLLADYLGSNILSISLGGPYADRTSQLATQQCDADGVLVVVAAGNWNTSAPSYPGYYQDSFCVGGSDLVNSNGDWDYSLTVDTNSDGTPDALPVQSRKDARVGFSNYGPWVDIAAPAIEMQSTTAGADDGYAGGGAGTSFACPSCAGCAALLWSYIGPNATADQVRGLLEGTETPLATNNNTANPKGFIDDSSNGSVGEVNVKAAMDLFDADQGDAPTLSWDNPQDGDTVSGIEQIRLAVSGGTGDVIRVDFEIPTRILATVTAEDSGFYSFNWDTRFEFNKPLPLTAKVYDSMGHMCRSTITVLPDNPHVTPDWNESFDGVANNTLPGGWYGFDGNQIGGNTSWGATDQLGSAAAPCMHTAGTGDDTAGANNNWLYSPIIDLRGKATAQLNFNLRYQGGEVYFLWSLDDQTYFYDYWNSGGMHEWETKSYNLTPLCGHEVRLLWTLTSGAGSGIWIDDVSIDSANGTPPTVLINAPQAGASVSGMVPVQVTVSDDTAALKVEAVPPVFGPVTYNNIPDNDPDNPTKTFSFFWDSRHVWSGPTRLSVTALDDENGDGQIDDLAAQQSVMLSVGNALKNPDFYDSFEGITTLGGSKSGGSLFDGDWYTWGSSGTSSWQISTDSPQAGTQNVVFGPAGGGNYGDGEFDQLLSPLHSVAGTVHPYLRLFQQVDLEGSGWGEDFAKLQLMQYLGMEETVITMAEYRQDTVPAGEWIEQDFPLDGYKAAPFRLDFLFSSDADGQAGKGWAIDSYEILDANPQISGFVPTRAPIGTSIAINGSNFGAIQSTSSVSFAKRGGGRVTAAVTSWSNNSIVVKVPDTAKTGDVIVKVLGWSSPGAQFKVVLAGTTVTGVGQL